MLACNHRNTRPANRGGSSERHKVRTVLISSGTKMIKKKVLKNGDLFKPFRICNLQIKKQEGLWALGRSPEND